MRSFDLTADPSRPDLLALDEARWHAIVECRSDQDGRFVYAVRTTGIYCRPSCRSRLPLRWHVRLFRRAAEAASEGYRPCKRCRPDALQQPDEQLATRVAECLASHLGEAVPLRRLGETFHSSPYHLQRLFKRVYGVSPAHYHKRLRLLAAAERLRSTSDTVSVIALRGGWRSVAHFAAAFRGHFGLTPTAYRASQAPFANQEACSDE
ncbi:methylphosphotriester-DNA--protein-cysteine methyltransferase family protein [Paenibacillus sp. IB182496]|uniref:Methylphosphotriester-DNA--protein-cysteine methyltransferase family protein n=1 Tax=Paenibacillus sabuli TaxID=2772509 RepID=A0A927GUP5_9BACL|nr:Ada metal-binding domain-containing protein [Paenibacillus sabuli]MBD2847922.1 methylphosphotriester-DNA--protein-cysteine methyltransferase family protein [Paenibacillus sabuli]